MHAFLFRARADPAPSSETWIGDEGAAAVCRALEKNTTLQSLNLSSECAALLGSCFFAFVHCLCLREGSCDFGLFAVFD
jgi:hypothetical protein